MKKRFILLIFTLAYTSVAVRADPKAWSHYRAVEHQQPNYPTRTYQYTDPYGRAMTQEIPIKPPQHQTSHLHPKHSNRAFPHDSQQQNRINIVYEYALPTQTQYRSTSRNVVYGNSNTTIQHSEYTLISDWRHYALPDPQLGMHWIYANGRYLQIPNDGEYKND